MIPIKPARAILQGQTDILGMRKPVRVGEF